MAKNDDASESGGEKTEPSTEESAAWCTAIPGKSAWTRRVAITNGPDSFAYVPHEVLTTGGEAAVRIASDLFPDAAIVSERLDLERAVPYQTISNVPEPLRLIAELRAANLVAQPNHVLFVHCECCPPHPFLTWGGCGPTGFIGTTRSFDWGSAHASALDASPAYASPAYASPAYASPAYASPAYASPAYASRRSSARPAVDPWVSIATERVAKAIAKAATAKSNPDAVRVVVLDTGLAMSGYKSAAIQGLAPLLTATGPAYDWPDGDGDQILDPAAGHGTFIAGLVAQVAPGTFVDLRRVLHAHGDGDEVTIAQAIDAIPDPGKNGAILNLSFGGTVMDHPGVLASAVARAQARGYVVVASAGNDATCRRTYPAACAGVIGVGAVGANGPAAFTNYGSWVRACAPGVDLVSTFFADWNGDATNENGVDPDDFHAGWACWSGTSFSAPVVAGALAKEMAAGGSTAAEAVVRLIDDPALLRIDGLGTVVNVR